jgi:alkylation response protein AidB-like acyl-CoA dehydrogenase
MGAVVTNDNPVFICPECGPSPNVDEAHLCYTCGAVAVWVCSHEEAVKVARARTKDHRKLAEDMREQKRLAMMVVAALCVLLILSVAADAVIRRVDAQEIREQERYACDAYQFESVP